MILYSIASIGFFLFALTTIFRLVNLWQISGFKYARLRLYARQQRKHFYSPLLSPLLLLFILGVYVFVIMNDNMTIWYQIGVTLFFCIEALLSFRNWRKIFKNFHITFTALAVTILSLIALIVLYLFPLLDQFVWLLLITLFLPLFVTAFVGFFSFPTELITDFLMQRAKRKLEKFPPKKVILLEGGSEINQLKHYLLHLLSPYFTVATNTSQENTPYSLVKIIRKQVHKDTDIILLTIQAVDKDAVDRLVGMLHPTILILSGIPKTIENHLKEKNRFLMTHKYFINSLSRNSVVVMNGENKDFLALTEQVKKPVLSYGIEENPRNKLFAILATNIHMRKDGIWFGLKLGRKRAAYKIRLRTKKELLLAIPVIFLGYILHIPENELVQLARQMGSPRKKKITSRINGKK